MSCLNHLYVNVLYLNTHFSDRLFVECVSVVLALMTALNHIITVFVIMTMSYGATQKSGGIVIELYII